jgi:death-on-curing protein
VAGEPRFLSVDDVLAIHEDTIGREGGLAGLRDPGLLESAVTMPQQRFAGAWLHPGLPAMAAAYLYHIASNHPFLDGNKRTAAMAALVFLDVNGRRKLPPPKALEQATLAVAAGTMTKARLIDWMKRQLRRRRMR